MEKHYVTFLSPGTFVAEDNVEEIDSWDVNKAVERAKSITQRYNARPYAFYFTTRSRGEDEFEPKQAARSATYYLPHCKVETVEDVRIRNDPKEEILLRNMENNGFNKIVTTTEGWKWTQPFREGDVLLSKNVEEST
ncbi:MAG TPA: hypothetical protein VMJ73_12235 [Rhizomicrobium sp.]|nr:hypothetical protein [Rhizomicrobium sp.]